MRGEGQAGERTVESRGRGAKEVENELKEEGVQFGGRRSILDGVQVNRESRPREEALLEFCRDCMARQDNLLQNRDDLSDD